jgi:hypothetical protein
MITIFSTFMTLVASCAMAAPTTNTPGNRFEFPARPTATGARKMDAARRDGVRVAPRRDVTGIF